MSLTPENRNQEATMYATYEGVLNGVLTLVPSVAAVGYALKNSPWFVVHTNWQSRTAIALMPALFVAGLSSELTLSHKMREMAKESQHHSDTVHWAEEQWEEQKLQSDLNQSQHLAALYQQSVKNQNVKVVPELKWYHKAANFTGDNPVRVLAAAAVPVYLLIFAGQNEQKHLQLAKKIMHTRVLGQAAAVTMLLGVMGFKDYMDKHGRFISEGEMNERVVVMQSVRSELMERLEEDKRQKADAQMKLKEAHEKDLMTKREKKQHKLEQIAHDLTQDANSENLTNKQA